MKMNKVHQLKLFCNTNKLYIGETTVSIRPMKQTYRYTKQKLLYQKAPSLSANVAKKSKLEYTKYHGNTKNNLKKNVG